MTAHTYDARAETYQYYAELAHEQNTTTQKTHHRLHQLKQTCNLVIWTKYLVLLAHATQTTLHIHHAQGHIHQARAFLTTHEYRHLTYTRHGKHITRSFPDTFNRI